MIINVALTGCVHMPKDSQYIPFTPNEIAKDIYKCAREGATIFHVHARDDDFKPTHSMDRYAEIVKRIREIEPKAIICVSTSGRYWQEFEKRADALYSYPDMASLTLGSFNFPSGPSINSPEMIQRLAQMMKNRGVRPELEVFDVGMIHYAKYLIGRGILEPPFYFNLFLGNLGTIEASRKMLMLMIDELPEGATWAATGIGRYQFEINCLAVAMGGSVRVGLEDSLWMDGYTKDKPATNEAQVHRIVAVAWHTEHPPWTIERVREQLCLRTLS